MFVIVVNFTKAIENQCFIFHMFFSIQIQLTHLTLLQMGIFGAAHGWWREGGGGQKGLLLPKTCHTYPIMMKLDSYTLPKEDPKNT